MDFHDFELQQRFRDAWEAVTIERPVTYSLFTFGESILPYYLVCSASEAGETVSLTQGEVKVARPSIITPDNARPEFRNFFEENQDDGIIDFLMARSAAFSHLKVNNSSGPRRYVSDSVQEVVDMLNRRLDGEEEDRVAILSAPLELAGVALLRYASERIWSSAPDNIQEMRERGFLP